MHNLLFKALFFLRKLTQIPKASRSFCARFVVLTPLQLCPIQAKVAYCRRNPSQSGNTRGQPGSSRPTHTHTHMPSLKEKHFRETFIHFSRASRAHRVARDHVTCRAAVDVQSEAVWFDGKSLSSLGRPLALVSSLFNWSLEKKTDNRKRSSQTASTRAPDT